MKNGRMFIMTCVLSILMLCTLGAVFNFQSNITDTTNYFTASAQDENNYTYNYTFENLTMPGKDIVIYAVEPTVYYT